MIAATSRLPGLARPPAQDLTAGATSYKKCAPATTSARPRRTRSDRCSTGSRAANPEPWRVIATPTPTRSSGITWNEETFLDYIKDPKAKIPNTKMAFAGIKNETEAKALWAYIKQYDAEGKTK